jgi:signal transduction histidine kinase/ActR/RegA family two-component response regulator
MSSDRIAELTPGVTIADLRGPESPQSAVDGEPHYQHAFLSSIASTPSDRRLALIVLLISALGFAVAVPFATVPMLRIDAFIPAYEAALIIIDIVTVVMLFGQFHWSRSPGLLMLGAGYLYDGILTLAHLVSFPGAFGPTGLLGPGGEVTPWLYTFWHGGFPLFIVGYAVLSTTRPQANRNWGRAFVPLTIVAANALAVGLTVLAINADAVLPAIMSGNTTTNWLPLMVMWASPMTAMAVLLWQRRWTVLNLWLIVVSCAWVFDVGLSSVFNSGRFDLGFYAGRGYGLLAASFVLGVLLVETTGLHNRLGAAKALLDEYAHSLEERVRARTSELEAETGERQKAEAQLHQAQKMEALGQLTGGLAHDFNNHLGIIIGNLDLLGEETRDDPERKELIEDALSAALNGADLTRRLLAFARRQPLRPARIVINELIGEITKLLRRTLSERIEIRLNFDPSIPPVLADPAQLESAIANLANNARDAMPEGGRLTITTGVRYLDEDYAAEHSEVTPGPYVLIEVSDTGSGMAPDTIIRVFEPFFTTKGPGKGTGLGLSMVFGFMRQSGGHINVYSELGRGTTFRLYLRPDETATDAIDLQAPSLDEYAGAGEHILVVEDNAKLRAVVIRQLVDLGYNVSEATTADEALAMLGNDATFNLLLTDVVMPGKLDGCALAREFVARRPGGKVLLTSGFPSARLTEDDSFDASLRLLDKPYRKQDLARALRETFADMPAAALQVSLTHC